MELREFIKQDNCDTPKFQNKKHKAASINRDQKHPFCDFFTNTLDKK